MFSRAIKRLNTSSSLPVAAAFLLGVVCAVAPGMPAHAAIQLSPVVVYNDWMAGRALVSQVDEPSEPDLVGEALAVKVGTDFAFGGRVGGEIAFSHVATEFADDLLGWTARRLSTLDTFISYRLPLGTGGLRLFAGSTIVDLREEFGSSDGGWGLKSGVAYTVAVGPRLTLAGSLSYAPSLRFTRRLGAAVQERFNAQAAEGQLVASYSLDNLLKNASLRLSASVAELQEELAGGAVVLGHQVASLGASYRF